MGLPNFGSPAEGVVPMLAMSAIMSVVFVKNKIRWVLGRGGDSEDSKESRRVSITRSLCNSAELCCVCLCGLEAGEEVAELLSCKHVFHRGCLDNWFHSHATTTCPLCRSTA